MNLEDTAAFIRVITLVVGYNMLGPHAARFFFCIIPEASANFGSRPSVDVNLERE